MVMSTGSGSVQQIQLESALGIKTGELDTTLNGTKAADNATEGSAAYDSVEVSAGDVISLDIHLEQMIIFRTKTLHFSLLMEKSKI